MFAEDDEIVFLVAEKKLFQSRLGRPKISTHREITRILFYKEKKTYIFLQVNVIFIFTEV